MGGKASVECVDAIFSARTAWEACIRVEQSRLRAPLSQMLGLVRGSSGLPRGVLLQRWERLLGASAGKLAPSQLFG